MRKPRPHRYLMLLLTPLMLAGCGLGDTGAAASTAAHLKAREAEQAKAAQTQINQQLDAAQQ